MILRAGHDTTTNMISLGVVLLLEHPDQLAAFKADPSLTEPAVEELLRYLSPVQFAPRRVALENVEIGGMTIRKGDGVFALSPRSTAIRTNSRTRSASTLPAGPIITCPSVSASTDASARGWRGSSFRLSSRKLFERFPDLRTAEPLNRLAFKYDSQIYGLYELPVVW